MEKNAAQWTHVSLERLYFFTNSMSRASSAVPTVGVCLGIQYFMLSHCSSTLRRTPNKMQQ